MSPRADGARVPSRGSRAPAGIPAARAARLTEDVPPPLPAERRVDWAMGQTATVQLAVLCPRSSRRMSPDDGVLLRARRCDRLGRFRPESLGDALRADV